MIDGDSLAAVAPGAGGGMPGYHRSMTELASPIPPTQPSTPQTSDGLGLQLEQHRVELTAY